MNYTQNLNKQTSNIPSRPGIYLYRNIEGRILYVGKAIDLKKRVRSYFSKNHKERRTAALVSEISSIDYYVTDNEVEALIMENNFIKENKPPYNVAFRDDKTYPYLAINISHKFPRIRYTRERQRKGTKYFGPYTSANAMRETLDLIISVFPVRSCQDTLFKRAKMTDSPCLYYHINRCSAPCVGKIGVTEYRRLVDQIAAFLDGRQEQVVKDLTKQMKKAALDQEFEKAAHFRDRIAAANKILTKQKVFSDSRIDQDVFGLAIEDGIGSAQLLKVRNGKMVGTEDLIIEKGVGLPKAELMSGIVKQYYLSEHYIPKEILVPYVLEDKEAIEKWLTETRGNLVHIKSPKKGAKNKLVIMAKENATHSLLRHKVKTDYDNRRTIEALAGLKRSLRIEKMDIIECYDISTIAGEHSVGSMVTFKAGQPEKKAYRKFKIKSVKGVNDFAMMKEVLSRRFSHYLADDDGKFALNPDLIIVDGGKPQLTAAIEVFLELEITNVSLVALAKREEELFIPGKKEPITLPKGSSELHLVQRIRDEAHRFAHTFHTELRSKTVRKSRLDSVSGIGPKRKRALIKKFGSLKKMGEVSKDDLEVVVGRKAGAELYEALKDKR